MNQDKLDKEKSRLDAMMKFERQAYSYGHRMIAGLDEVGRGPLAGPVVAAAVILPPRFFLAGVDDSKKLTALKRNRLAVEIKKQAVSWAVASVYPARLDEINILNATREAMRLCIMHLSPQPDLLLIDALRLNDINIKQFALVRGDSVSATIACASILAKVERDQAMEGFDQLYPGYGLAKHKGYATREHIESIWRQGPCDIHRKSFEPIKSWLSGGSHAQQPALFEQNES
ncbi:MAG: ribonuclease HII [Syntrophomonadaceae bacterium]